MLQYPPRMRLASSFQGFKKNCFNVLDCCWTHKKSTSLLVMFYVFYSYGRYVQLFSSFVLYVLHEVEDMNKVNEIRMLQLRLFP